MRLTRIEAHEIFSFGTLILDDLPEQTLIVVGPNGSGKTNLLRLVQIVLAAIERSATSSMEAYHLLSRFGAARRFEAMSANVSSVRLGIAITEKWERELLLGFVRAAIMTSILRDNPGGLDESHLLAWISEISADALTPLMQGEIVANLVDATLGQWTLGYEFEVDEEKFCWVLEGAPSAGAIVRVSDARPGVPSYGLAQKLNLDENRTPRKSFAFADLLPPTGEAHVLSLDGSPSPAREPAREWAALAGIPFAETQGRSYSLAWVLHVLLIRGLNLLGDLRQPPANEYSVTETAFDPSTADGSRVPLRLFRLKNGNPGERARFAASQELFTRLTGLEFDVTLATSTGTSTQRDEQSATVLISLVVGRQGHDLPVEFAGAGIWEALLLSATLSDSAGRVALLDEPARNLHPTLQRRLLGEVRRAPGQFIVTTHSPYLVSFDENTEITSTIRFDLMDGATRASRLAKGDAKDDARLRKVLGESADARSLLFARGVILVEGGTELGALPEWFGKSATAKKHGTPDALNVDIFSVDSDTGYGTSVRFLHGLGVPWAIVCDGGILRFGTGKSQVFKQVIDAGVTADELRNAIDGSETHTFTDIRNIGARHGIFTVATDWNSPAESIEAYIDSVVPGHLDAAEKIVGKSKPRKGRHVATDTDCPAEIDALYAQILEHLGVINPKKDIRDRSPDRPFQSNHITSPVPIMIFVKHA
jgi:energy-coupling factor transporter ATP-binding protein EcfA2